MCISSSYLFFFLPSVLRSVLACQFSELAETKTKRRARTMNAFLSARPTLARPQEVKGKVHAAREGRARRGEASGPNTRHSPRMPEEWGSRGVIGRVELKKDQDEETVRPTTLRPPAPLPSSTHGIKGLSEIGSNASEGRPTTLPST